MQKEEANPAIDLSDIVAEVQTTFTLTQVETMLSHLKTQHQAEKRVLIQEALMLRHVTKMMAK